jgi:hypothetical protein
LSLLTATARSALAAIAVDLICAGSLIVCEEYCGASAMAAAGIKASSVDATRLRFLIAVPAQAQNLPEHEHCSARRQASLAAPDHCSE